MNICGCLVHVVPERAESICPLFEAVDGVEVHAVSEDGRIVIVVEDTPGRRASQTIMDLHQIPGVISLTLTYHHFEELGDEPCPSALVTQPQAGGQPHDNL